LNFSQDIKPMLPAIFLSTNVLKFLVVLVIPALVVPFSTDLGHQGFQTSWISYEKGSIDI